MILAIRTDKPESYVALTEAGELAAETSWEAHRELSDTLLKTIENELHSLNVQWDAISGIVVFKGPGSFTGLRIGVTVANTLAMSLGVPIVGTQTDDWLANGEELLANDQNEKIVTPEYGGVANITQPRK